MTGMFLFAQMADWLAMFCLFYCKNQVG